MTKELICKQCGGPRKIGRRLCEQCNRDRLKEAARSRPRYMYNNICVACKEDFIAWRKTQELCSKCILDMRAIAGRVKASNKYIKDANGKSNFHRTISEEAIGSKLAKDEVVHHMDCNYLNNSLDNLMIMSNGSHSRLHKYLGKQRLILEKSLGEIADSRWNELVVPMTMEWIKTTNTEAVIVSEINSNKMPK